MTTVFSFLFAFDRAMMSEMSLAEFEMAQLGNLCPESAEEARALIPSLSGKIDDDLLQKILEDMATARRLQS
jgi:DNA-directed RNA polymerase II subunit RPB4